LGRQGKKKDIPYLPPCLASNWTTASREDKGGGKRGGKRGMKKAESSTYRLNNPINIREGRRTTGKRRGQEREFPGA